MDNTMTQVRAPYNFVPFSAKVLKYSGELPDACQLRPDLKTGEIHITMTADTPVFVSDGCRSGHKDPTKNKTPGFFRGANGKYQIPGSTIRGMVRENMQILGFGCLRKEEDLDDYQVYFRDVAYSGTARKYYTDVLGVETVAKNVTIPTLVESGYIYHKGETYFIRKTKSPVLRVSREHPDAQGWITKFAETMEVGYQAQGGKVVHIVPWTQGMEGMEHGFLLFTGKSVGKPNRLYLFPDAAKDVVNVSEKDVHAYQQDWEVRKNVLKPSTFWALPKEGEIKPIFFLWHEGHLYFGMSRFLRIGYRHTLAEGLPKRHLDLQKSFALDYPHAILGYAHEKDSRKSRVSFGSLEAIGTPQEEQSFSVVLGQPRPSYYPGYSVGGLDYSKDTFQLRGYKQYWLKNVQSVPSGNENVSASLSPLPAGTRFRGVIRFSNLSCEELGLLLWSLRLEEGCYQSIGMGKPYGYGRMKLHIDLVQEVDWNRHYSLKSVAGAQTDISDRLQTLIDCYDGFAAKKLRIEEGTLRNRPEIKDFLYIRSVVRNWEEVSYMSLQEYKDGKKLMLPAISDVCAAAPKAENKSETPSDPNQPLDLSQLLKKNNSL